MSVDRGIYNNIEGEVICIVRPTPLGKEEMLIYSISIGS
jgi:hypothetical protein